MRRPTADPQILSDQDDLTNINLRELYRVWDGARGDLPGPTVLDIIAVPAMTPLVAIARMEGGQTPDNAIVIYVGSEIVKTAVIDPTGMRVSELKSFPNMYRLVVRCIETRTAMKVGPTKVANERNEFMSVELICLPLFEDAATLSGLVYGVAYLRR